MNEAITIAVAGLICWLLFRATDEPETDDAEILRRAALSYEKGEKENEHGHGNDPRPRH